LLHSNLFLTQKKTTQQQQRRLCQKQKPTEKIQLNKTIHQSKTQPKPLFVCGLCLSHILQLGNNGSSMSYQLALPKRKLISCQQLPTKKNTNTKQNPHTHTHTHTPKLTNLEIFLTKPTNNKNNDNNNNNYYYYYYYDYYYFFFSFCLIFFLLPRN
jgi:hypothetical protein